MGRGTKGGPLLLVRVSAWSGPTFGPGENTAGGTAMGLGATSGFFSSLTDCSGVQVGSSGCHDARSLRLGSSPLTGGIILPHLFLPSVCFPCT